MTRVIGLGEGAVDRVDPRQVVNNAGGYTFEVDAWGRLDRFLILGSEGGTYYASERKLTRENAGVVTELVRQDGARVIRRVVEVSEAGRAPKNDPAILALAIAARADDPATRAAAYAALPRVCRIGTHLYHFAAYMNQTGGWGRGLRTAIARWFTSKTADDAAFQMIKYQSRDGWSAKDLLRLSHVKPPTPAHDALFRWVTRDDAAAPGAPDMVHAYAKMVAATDVRDVCRLITDHRLQREMVPTTWLDKPEVWAALLPNLGLTALIRNLATLTRVGVIAPLADAVSGITARLTDATAIAKARVHPIQFLSALKTYASGHGVRGSGTWVPNQSIIDALDAGFYASFASVVPTGLRTLLAIDVSGSMTGGVIAGVPGLDPRTAAAAMAMATVRTEPRHHLLGFSHRLVDIPVSARHRLDDVVRIMDNMPFGSTDCALPFTWAKEGRKEVDSFAVYTDNETWYGSVHPHVALKTYRRATGLAARSAVVGFTATEFTIADPSDAGMMDFVGFDAAAPAIMAEFFRS